MENMWVIRAGKDTLNFNLYKKENFVSVGDDIGNIKSITLDEIKFRLKGKADNVDFQAGVIRRFRDEVQIGDYFICTSPNSLYFLLGEIIGDVEYNPDLSQRYHYTCYRRSVKWISKVYRNDLSDAAKRALSPQISVFKVKDKWQNEIFDNQVSLGFPPNQSINSNAHHNDEKDDSIGHKNYEEEYDFTKDKILFKYADLYKEGLITREEFEAKKKELL